MMDRGYWANLARMPGLHPYSFDELFKFVEQLFRLSYRTKLLRFQM